MWGKTCLAVLLLGVATAADAQPYKVTANYGAWRAECQDDKMSDKRFCRVLADIRSTQPLVVASIYINVNDRSVAVIAAPAPLIVQIRIDKNKAIGRTCQSICIFTPAESATLLQQMAKGNTMLYSITTVRGNIDPTELSLNGFTSAMQAAR